MDARRYSISSFSNLGMPSFFGAYALTPSSAQGFEGPYQQSPYNVQYHNETVSSSDAYQGHEDAEHHEAQPSEEETPRSPQGKRNPTRNRRQPQSLFSNGEIIQSDDGVQYQCETLKLFCIPYNCTFNLLNQKVSSTLELPPTTAINKLYFRRPTCNEEGVIVYDARQISTDADT
ncbi:unnamed protein product [Sphenostylis stenocarpa]|uniref:Uncharacterized protein n=1 Tax=Sphenostylis stenocarpa TaxID=92480 RepID=A0AA86SS52_9FABA|nr:unnamed protein product [Sphenostylis stenocarpa]